MEGTQQPAGEKVIGAVTGIAVPGMATMSYWTVVRTDQATYFIRASTSFGVGLGGNPLMLAASVIGDVVGQAESRNAGASPLQEALAKAEESFRFSDAELSKVTNKKGLLGGSVTFSNGKEKSWKESGIVKLKLSYGKWKQYMTLMQAPKA